MSVSPWTELQIGYGQPVTGELLAAGLRVGLSVDTTMLSGNADLFAIMKVTQACANGQARHEFALTARDVLRLATIYDLTEFATAVKPLFMLMLLEDTEQAVYLDPDTYVEALFEEGALVRNGEIKVARSPSGIQIPATVQAVLDALRIDHFRGFEAYWEVLGNETAANCCWIKAAHSA